VIGGAQFGYNFLISPIWLVGFETDIQGSSQKGSGLSGFAGFVPNGTGCTTTICEYSDLTDITAKLTWFGTVRGRTGVIWNNILFYGTFGLAYGEIKISGTNVFAAQFLHSGNSVTYVTPLDYSKIATGIAGGGGIEGQLALPGWIWRLEYLHLDFGSVDGNFVGLPPITVSTKVTDEIVRIAFSYQLSGMP
jgi:outer membrane immunogenic protein